MVTQTWTTSKDLTKTPYTNDPKPGKESGCRNREDPCQSQSTGARQRASPQATCTAWELQPGGGNRREMKSCKPPVREGRIPELWKLVGQGAHRCFSPLSLRKMLPSWKHGRKLLPHGRRDGATMMWGCLQERGSWLWDVALWSLRAGRKDGDQEVSSAREVALRWAVAGTQGENLGIATVRRALWGVLHMGAGMQERVGNLRIPNFLSV